MSQSTGGAREAVDAARLAQVPTVRILQAGLALWTLALVLTLLVPAWHSGDRHWWPLTCGFALFLGAGGYGYVRRGRGNAAGAS